MSARSIRRAAERRAAKLARKADQIASVNPSNDPNEPVTAPKTMTASVNGDQPSSHLTFFPPGEVLESFNTSTTNISDARLAANRANAKRSAASISSRNL